MADEKRNSEHVRDAICALCDRHFTTLTTEAEMAAEYTANGFDPDEERVEICDQCYQNITPYLKPGSGYVN